VGLIPDGKLLELLDLALSAEAGNTVRFMRELLKSGVEPLSLVSQLACLITNILAGSFDVHPETHLRGFFRKNFCK
jgi:DNA polymerase III gamma/tau subunit